MQLVFLPVPQQKMIQRPDKLILILQFIQL